MPDVTDRGRRGELRASNENLVEYMRKLSDRLRRVRICCGDWTRVLGPSVTTANGITAVFLDPPYSSEANREAVYTYDDMDIAHKVRAWALANGDNPEMRIALCGYSAEHDSDIPATWERMYWKTNGGYGNQGEGRGRDNAECEVVWFSPHCIKPESTPEQLSWID